MYGYHSQRTFLGLMSLAFTSTSLDAGVVGFSLISLYSFLIDNSGKTKP